MPKLSNKAIRYGRTDGWTDPNYRKASLLKTPIHKFISNNNKLNKTAFICLTLLFCLAKMNQRKPILNHGRNFVHKL